MKESPILFNAAMVQAILAGNKTQTRRVWEMPSWAEWDGAEGETKGCINPKDKNLSGGYDLDEVRSPFGRPGDHLYVKETWGVISYEMDSSGTLHDWTPDRPATQIHEMPFGRGYYSGHVIYRADGEFEFTDLDTGQVASQWKPSIHMPRLASRIQLEITGVRVERLQTISEEDAKAEGADQIISDNATAETRALLDLPLMEDGSPYRNGYALLWESIYGDGTWAVNPWVWVIEFKLIKRE